MKTETIKEIVLADFKLLNLLEKEKIFNTKQIDYLIDQSKKLNISPIELALHIDAIDEDKIIDILSQNLGFTKINLSTVSISQEATKLMNRNFAITHTFFPVKVDHNSLTIAMFNPFQVETIMEIENKTGYSVKSGLATKKDILDSIEVFYPEGHDHDNSFDELHSMGDLVNQDAEADTRLMHFLENNQLLTPEKTKYLIQEAKLINTSPIDLTIQHNEIDEEKVIDVLAKHLNVSKANLDEINVDQKVLEMVPQYTAYINVCLPLTIKDNKLILAVFNPFRFNFIKNLEKQTNLKILIQVATRSEIMSAIKRVYENSTMIEPIVKQLDLVPLSALPSLTNLEGIDNLPFEIKEYQDDKNILGELSSNEAPIVKLTNMIIYSAIKAKSSDVHIETTQNSVLVRNRIDGILQEVQQFPKSVQNGLISRFKILAKIDISERRIPQDGNIKVRFYDKDIDIRISTLPTQHGEKIVLRVLDTSSIKLKLDELGFTPKNLTHLKTLIRQPQGIILVTGPTGSGKTSTLYACLNEINSKTLNLITVEDPVEYSVSGINQVQLNKKAGLNFASTLRAILRQDPDVIMVGEIRDFETAEIAFHASMTGHLVMSTLHTNDSISTITRLIDLGVPEFLIASSLLMVISQRLVRKICKNCIAVYKPDEELVQGLGLHEKHIEYKHGKGCKSCRFTGFSGRVAIYELLNINTEIKMLINQKADESEISKAVKKRNMKFMIDDAIDKIKQGLTTVEEVSRVIPHTELTTVLCHSCNRHVKETFNICPYCNNDLFQHCVLCKHKLEPDWLSCPNCNLNIGKKVDSDDNEENEHNDTQEKNSSLEKHGKKSRTKKK